MKKSCLLLPAWLLLASCSTSNPIPAPVAAPGVDTPALAATPSSTAALTATPAASLADTAEPASESLPADIRQLVWLDEGALWLWDGETARDVYRPSGEVRGTALSPNGHYIALSLWSPHLVLVDLDTREVVLQLDGSALGPGQGPIEGSERYFMPGLWLDHETLLFNAGEEGGLGGSEYNGISTNEIFRLTFRDSSDWEITRLETVGTGGWMSLSPDYTRLAIIAPGRYQLLQSNAPLMSSPHIRFMDVETWTEIMRIPLEEFGSDHPSVSWHPDGLSAIIDYVDGNALKVCWTDLADRMDCQTLPIGNIRLWNPDRTYAIFQERANWEEQTLIRITPEEVSFLQPVSAHLQVGWLDSATLVIPCEENCRGAAFSKLNVVDFSSEPWLIGDRPLIRYKALSGAWLIVETSGDDGLQLALYHRDTGEIAPVPRFLDGTELLP